MSDEELTPERIATLTAAVDIEAPPPDGEPVALVLFGTNQAAPAQIAAARHHAGTAPLVIATGGVNRHNGIIEGREFARQLTQAGVPGDVIRVEDQSKDTWQNVELSLPHLREALALGLRLAVVSKWYHLRTIYSLATLLPEAAPFHAISWEPVYAGTLVTRASWPKIPDGRRRVVRESQEVPRRVAEGTYRAARKADGTWQLPDATFGVTRQGNLRANHTKTSCSSVHPRRGKQADRLTDWRQSLPTDRLPHDVRLRQRRCPGANLRCKNHAHASFAITVIRARVRPIRRALFIKDSNTSLYW